MTVRLLFVPALLLSALGSAHAQNAKPKPEKGPTYRFASLRVLGKRRLFQGQVQELAYRPDGKLLCLTWDGVLSRSKPEPRLEALNRLLLWDLSAKKPKVGLRLPGTWQSCELTRDGRYAVSVGPDRFMVAWDLDAPKGFLSRKDVDSATISADGKLLLSAGHSPRKGIAILFAYEGTTGKWLWGHNIPSGGKLAVHLSPDASTFVVVGTKRQHVALWDTATKTVRHKLPRSGRVSDLAFSPDGALLATAHSDKLVRIWSVQDGKLVRELAGHKGWALSVAFSPDGSLLAKASRLA